MVKEQIYVWVLVSNASATVFLGYDHIRRVSKSYSSSNEIKMNELAQKMASTHSTEIIHNFTATVHTEKNSPTRNLMV